MRLHLSPEDQAFREEMRPFFTTQVPQSIRNAVAARRDVEADEPLEDAPALIVGQSRALIFHAVL